MNKIKFHEFNSFLSDTLAENFPDADLFMVSGGDFAQDIIMEVRLKGKKLQYKPYQLYRRACCDDKFGYTIERFIKDIADM